MEGSGSAKPPRPAPFSGLSGVAGVAGGLGWTALVILTFALTRGITPLENAALDALTPVALALALAGVAGYRARTREAWGRLAGVGFAVLAAGLLGALVGSFAYVVGGQLAGWTFSVWAYLLGLVGATVFGVGLLWAGVPPRSGAVLLAIALPAGLAASLSLAVGGVVPDEAVVPVGPGALLGLGVAVGMVGVERGVAPRANVSERYLWAGVRVLVELLQANYRGRPR